MLLGILVNRIMAIIIDHDDEALDPAIALHRLRLDNESTEDTLMSDNNINDEDDRPNPNVNSFSVALGCYP